MITEGTQCTIKNHVRQEFYWMVQGTGPILIEAGTRVTVTEVDEDNDVIMIETQDGNTTTVTTLDNLVEITEQP